MWGGGHVCGFPRTADGPQWLPERLVKQHHGETREQTVQEGEEGIGRDLNSQTPWGQDGKQYAVTACVQAPSVIQLY